MLIVDDIMTTVDLNCDMGEGMLTDAAIFPFISSTNIACGFHAGDADTMRRTVELALRHKVAIGAHPGYRDADMFGRVDLLATGAVALDEISGLVVDQLIMLQAICEEYGTRLHHVKPHGALYNRAAIDGAVGDRIARAILEFDPSLLLYGLSGSEMKKSADKLGIGFVSEVFADRTYQPDGTLTPRSLDGALIAETSVAFAQALRMTLDGRVTAVTGEDIVLVSETICLHGDGAHAVQFAEVIYGGLLEKGVRIVAPAAVTRDAAGLREDPSGL